MRPLARDAAAIRSASARVSATGFSHTTWYPCSKPHTMSSRWDAVGVQISMKSSGAWSLSAARSRSSGIPSTGGMPGALSTTATTSTRARSAGTPRKDELDRAGKRLHLARDVIGVPARPEPLQPRAARRGVQVLGEVELAAAAHADVEVCVADEVDRLALERVREPGGRDQQARARPPVPCGDESVHQMKVQVDEAEVVVDPVQDPPEARGRAAQPRQLSVRRIEHIRHDEQPE